MSSYTNKSAVPATLLAPRYSHLLDEAVAISRNEAGWSSKTSPVAYRSASVPMDEQREVSLPPQSPAAALRAESEMPMTPNANAGDTSSIEMPPPPPPQSIASRMKGFFFSYLPRATKPGPRPVKKPAHPGLPIPPPEVFQKPRGPISTPVSKPPVKPAHPKDLVQLDHVPPPKPSRIPRPAQQPPRRLVELNHVDLPPEHVHERPRSSMSVLSDRRSSSGSVRDLVKGFETLEQQQAREMAEERTKLKRVRSVGEWAATAGPGAAARTQRQGKRAWR